MGDAARDLEWLPELHSDFAYCNTVDLQREPLPAAAGCDSAAPAANSSTETNGRIVKWEPTRVLLEGHQRPCSIGRAPVGIEFGTETCDTRCLQTSLVSNSTHTTFHRPG